MEVVISTSQLNSYGFRVLTEGIDVEQFEKNPIMLWMHNRPFRGVNEEVLPIGRIENLRVEDDKLIGTPVFDEKDPFASKIKAKWDAGFLKMASAGLRVIEQSDDEKYLLQGQRYATVTKCQLQEVSIVDIGANSEALALYDDDTQLELSLKDNIGILKLINKSGTDCPQNQLKMEELLKELGLAADATQEEALNAIKKLKLKADEADNAQLALITSQVQLAVDAGKITEEKKAHYVTLGQKMGVEYLNDTLGDIKLAEKPKPEDKLSRALADKSSGGSNNKTFDMYSRAELETLRSENPQEYCKLYSKHFGVELTPEML